MNLMEVFLLRKRAIAWMVIDQLKNNSQVGHNRHRNQINIVINMITGLIAYYHKPKKASLNINLFQTLLIAYP
jgi:hypothetical protein